MLSAKGQATTRPFVLAPSCRGLSRASTTTPGMAPRGRVVSTVSFISSISFVLVDDVALAQGRNEQAIDAGAGLPVSNSDGPAAYAAAESLRRAARRRA